MTSFLFQGIRSNSAESRVRQPDPFFPQSPFKIPILLIQQILSYITPFDWKSLSQTSIKWDEITHSPKGSRPLSYLLIKEERFLSKRDQGCLTAAFNRELEEKSIGEALSFLKELSPVERGFITQLSLGKAKFEVEKEDLLLKVQELFSLLPHLKLCFVDLNLFHLHQLIWYFPSSLTTVILNGERLSDTELVSIFNRCPQIEDLELANCIQITDKVLPYFPSALKELNLEDMSISYREFLTIFQRCLHLKSLSLISCFDVVDACLAPFFTQIEELAFDDIPFSSDTIRLFLAASPNLKILSITNCLSELDENTFTHLSSSIEEVEFNYCDHLIESGLGVIFDRCPHLRILHLEGCASLTGESFEGRFLHLEELFLNWVYFFLPKLIESFCASKELKKLSLVGCQNLSEVAIYCLPPSLEEIDLSDVEITQQQLQLLSKTCLNLKKIRIDSVATF